MLADEPIVLADLHNDLNLEIILGSIKKSITPREFAHGSSLSEEEEEDGVEVEI